VRGAVRRDDQAERLSVLANATAPSRWRAMVSTRHLGFVAILLLALGFRLYHIDWGLPSLLDPDEATFVLLALELIRRQSLNPGWFGHPGTTTIYMLAIVEIGVYLTGYLAGHYPTPEALAKAAYHDPGLLFLPGRYLMALSGVACVALTYQLARTLFDRDTAIIAMLILAVDPLHVQWSQLIRTDVQASMFILASLYFCVSVARHGRLRDHVLAGVMAGLATATKWPSASIMVCLAAASLHYSLASEQRRMPDFPALILAGIAALAALVIASPYLVLDFHTAFQQARIEVQARHLGHAGYGFLGNIGWYAGTPFAQSFGYVGLALVGWGTVVAAHRHPVSRVTMLLAGGVFMLVLCVQQVVWSRWMVPALPYAAILAALAIMDLARRLLPARPLPAILALTALLTVPMASATVTRAQERANETRVRADRWIRANIPAHSSIMIEYHAFDLIDEPFDFFVPAGNIGCVNGREFVKGKTKYKKVDGWRRGNAVVDIGTINSAAMDSCRADYAVLMDYDRYIAEAKFYPRELAQYRRFLAGAKLLAVFKPESGTSTGYVIRIYRLPTRAPAVSAP